MTISKRPKSYDLGESERLGDLAVTNLAFCHEFEGAGEQVIDFNSLVPSSAWSTSGRSNPNPSQLLSTNLSAFKNHVEVISSLRGAIQSSEYQVRDSQIRFYNIESEAFESFEIRVKGLFKTGNFLVDVKNYRIRKILPNGTTQFPLGRAVKINSETEEAQIVVFRDGLEMSPDNVNGDGSGNFKFLDPNNTGFSSVIEFNQAASGGATGPSVVDNTTTTGEVVSVLIPGLADRPSVSTFQEIEAINGRLQKVIETLIDVVSESGDGIDESDFNGPATTVDLVQFANRVLQNERNIDQLEDPTLQSDVIATKLGQRQYESVADSISITSDATNFSVVRGVFVPYQMNSGVWRMRVNISATHDVSASHTITISGVIFESTLNNSQSVTINSANNSNNRSVTVPNSGDITLSYGSGSGGTNISADVELDAKPAWAI